MTDGGAAQTKVEVKTRRGRHYITMQDFLNHPSYVRDELLPEYDELLVTRFGEVVLSIRRPEMSELIEYDEF